MLLRRALTATVAVFVFAALTPAAAGASRAERVDDHLQSIRHDPVALREFMRALPKGGDIHTHLSGAVYAESLVRYAADDGLCLDVLSLNVSPPPCDPGDRPASDAISDGDLYNRVIAAWSMRGFTPGVESSHDHFFATFLKFDAAFDRHVGDALAEVAQRAISQREHYLEPLTAPAFGAALNLGERVGFDGDFAATRRRLLDAGMADVVGQASQETDEVLDDFRTTLRCDTPSAGAACDLPIRFDYEAIRVLSPAQVFAQLVLAFELTRTDPRWVGVNLVAPEDDIVSLDDYRLHMAMLGYLHGVYPRSHITLHAGELVPGLVPPADLRFHIRSAVEQGKAERIGHGVDVRDERDPVGLAHEMRRRHVPVEIALTSNRQILGVSGRRHPFRFYRAHGVPMTLATDDEGIERTDLSAQYRLAFAEYRLHYSDLKQLSENALTYGFLQPGAKRAAQRSLDDDFGRFERRYGAAR